jgi:hypothetical protein
MNFLQIQQNNVNHQQVSISNINKKKRQEMGIGKEKVAAK